jgi:nicotinate dehydrogenase subunit B
MLNLTLNRREFLAAGGSLVVSFALAPGAFARQTAPIKTVSAGEVDGFLAIAADGTVTVYSGKVDLGTGVRTALMQIAAEELDVPHDRIRVIEGDTLLTPDQGATTSSVTISRGGMEIRRAAATARAALINEAAKVLGTPPEQLTTENGAVVSRADGRNVPYSRLVGGKNFSLKLDAKARVKDPKTYRIVGKPVARVDIPEKVAGTFIFMHDFLVPGMMHARVIRPPTMRGRLISLDDTAARRIPGYVSTVRKNDFVAVIARDEWAAIRAARAVRT